MSLKLITFAMMKKLNQAINIMLLYGLFTISGKSLNILKWPELLAETFAFYALAIIIFTWMLKFKADGNK